MSVIDSHHHFWRFDPVAYDWIKPEQEILRHDFLPADLKKEIAPFKLDGVISVQARPTEAETAWLLELASQNDIVRGVVGWAPLTAPNAAEVIDRCAAHPKLRGLRHVVHDEPDDQFILRDDFNRGVALLASRNLVYDILIFERHLPQTIPFVDRHPDQVFVLDHIAKPKIAGDELEPWRTHIRELARRPNVYCKVSGMVTEADHENWTESRLWPFFDTVVEAFTPQRLMFGSDWPVCLLASSYRKWIESVDTWIDFLSVPEQNRIMGETAIEAYGLTI